MAILGLEMFLSKALSTHTETNNLENIKEQMDIVKGF